MTDIDTNFEEGRNGEASIAPEAVAHAKKDVETRCKAAGLPAENVLLGPDALLKVGMKCARDVRWLYLSDERVVEFSSIPFEKWVFLATFDAICSYEDSYIEAWIRPSSPGFVPSSFAYRKLFGPENPRDPFDYTTVKIVLEPPQTGFPRIEISAPSDVFGKLMPLGGRRLTLKVSGCKVSTHDEAVALLKKAAGSTFFQIDLLSDIPLALERARRRAITRRPRRKVDLAADLQYPKTELDDAPLSLYWYGRSASGMPLLQFLAFYQVIEFYFPVYSQAEAQRKLKAMLKDPTFRGDRDADIAKLLSSIYVSRSGSFGDERSQLRATLMECVDSQSLRNFLESYPDRKEFYLAKAKGLPYHKVPLANPTADLRSDVADRMYDIRCKIVHTKNDAREGGVDLLLPFSQEAEQLSFDIELAQYVAQLTLIAGSLPFRSNS
ncbi:MAG: hypothetical protein ABSG52_00505 [Terriglobales bacterium]|jgi:hypothetical protein